MILDQTHQAIQTIAHRQLTLQVYLQSFLWCFLCRYFLTDYSLFAFFFIRDIVCFCISNAFYILMSSNSSVSSTTTYFQSSFQMFIKDSLFSLFAQLFITHLKKYCILLSLHIFINRFNSFQPFQNAVIFVINIQQGIRHLHSL